MGNLRTTHARADGALRERRQNKKQRSNEEKGGKLR